MMQEKNPKKITTVIFDIGNVLMRFCWKEYTTALFPDETVRNGVNDAIWGKGLWNEMDRGLVGQPEIMEQCIKVRPEYEQEIRLAFANCRDCMFPFEYAIPWVKEVKSLGFQVLFLSNYSVFIMDQKPEVLNFLPYMDGGVFSCHVHQVKPDRDIYETLCRRYELDPANCLFIDDNAANVEAARAFGIQAVLFEGYEKTYPEVMEKLRGSRG